MEQENNKSSMTKYRYLHFLYQYQYRSSFSSIHRYRRYRWQLYLLLYTEIDSYFKYSSVQSLKGGYVSSKTPFINNGFPGLIKWLYMTAVCGNFPPITVVAPDDGVCLPSISKLTTFKLMNIQNEPNKICTETKHSLIFLLLNKLAMRVS